MLHSVWTALSAHQMLPATPHPVLQQFPVCVKASVQLLFAALQTCYPRVLNIRATGGTVLSVALQAIACTLPQQDTVVL